MIIIIWSGKPIWKPCTRVIRWADEEASLLMMENVLVMRLLLELHEKN